MDVSQSVGDLAVELAWLADSLEAVRESQGDCKSAGPAPTLDEGPEPKPVSNPIAVSLVVIALLFGALFTMGCQGVWGFLLSKYVIFR